MASLLVLLRLTPPPTSRPHIAPTRGAMAEIATWIVLPPLVADANRRPAGDRRHPRLSRRRLGLGEGGDGNPDVRGRADAVSPSQGSQPKRERARRRIGPGEFQGATDGERATLSVPLAVSTANVALGVRRPRITRLRSRTLPQRSASGNGFGFRQNRPPGSLSLERPPAGFAMADRRSEAASRSWQGADADRLACGFSRRVLPSGTRTRRQMHRPPSTSSTMPVRKLASSLARKSAAWPCPAASRTAQAARSP